MHFMKLTWNLVTKRMRAHDQLHCVAGEDGRRAQREEQGAKNEGDGKLHALLLALTALRFAISVAFRRNR